MTLEVRAPLAWLGPDRLVAAASVICDGGVVTYAGPSADAPEGADEVADVQGFVMPAAADRHVHIGLSDPGSVVRRGVTAVRDLGWPAKEILGTAEASEWGSFDGPLIVPAGPMLTAPGGYPMQEEYAPPGFGVEVGTAEDAVWIVEDLLARGARTIKVSLNADAGPVVDDAVLAAIVATAAVHEVPVTAHAQGKGQVERALGAGVRELAHTPWTEALSDRTIRAMAGSVRVVSTLDILSHGNDTPAIRTALDNLRRFHDAGGSIVYGTDLGSADWGIPPGIHVRELLLMGQAGMSNDEVIGSLIRAPLEPGAPADLIALPESPFSDLTALDELLLVVRSGRVVWSASG